MPDLGPAVTAPTGPGVRFEPGTTVWRQDIHAHGRRLGFIADENHRLVEHARKPALGLPQDRSGAVRRPVTGLAPDAVWPLPAGSPEADREGRARWQPTCWGQWRP
ncbi:hypothetical protein ACFC1R_08815 [Kitasatospora sp. NPDC056138]|uniref:hypothetical protein n=1 Tax=Kitasatospora sp. NPDC056138 TaxID=3345724 RepID=UPI0035E1F52F